MLAKLLSAVIGFGGKNVKPSQVMPWLDAWDDSTKDQFDALSAAMDKKRKRAQET